jgi:superfamily II DNA or RNA helicase
VTAGEPHELDWLWDYLSFEDTQREAQMRAMGQRGADARVHLYQSRARVFPTGLLQLVRRGCAQRGYKLQEVDTRQDAPQDNLDGLTSPPVSLRDYQVDAVRAALDASQAQVEHADPGRGILWVPTGGGKGRIAVAIAHCTPGKWLFLVHRSHLAADIAQRWRDVVGDTEPGVIGEGGWSVGARFTVASLQTLYANRGTPRFKSLVEQVTGLIGDEIHTGAARTHYSVIQAFTNARLRIGLSATPLARGDNRSLVTIGAFGPVVYRIQPETLFAKGVLARPTVRVVPLHQSSTATTWQTAYQDLVVKSYKRNKAVLECTRRAEKPAMLFVTSIKHGRQLASDLCKRGTNAEFVSGSASLDRRKRAVADLTSGRLDVVVATGIFNEGVDIPCLRSVIVAAGGKSAIATVQRAGRALRVESGKDTATIYDIGDKGNHWLARHARERVRAYQREGYPLVVDRSVCPE